MLVEGNENGNWLGGRDSNPDNLLQRQMSYRWTTSQYQSGAPEGWETPIIVTPFAPQQAPPLTWYWVSLLHLAGVAGFLRLRGRAHAVRGVSFLFPPMARHATLASGCAGLFAGPLVSRTLLMGRLAAL